jgi:protein-tyrosine phosphatase
MSRTPPSDSNKESDDESDKPNTGSIRTIPPNESQYAGYTKAFAAQIGDRELWIANERAVKPENLEVLNLGPEYVISLNRTPAGATTDYHPLRDAFLNDQQSFRNAVETARKRYRQSGQTIINCAAGISRSATVIAATIAAEEGLSFDTAVNEIKETRPRADPHPKLQISALRYLATVTNTPDAKEKLEEIASSIYSGKEDDEKLDDLIAIDQKDPAPEDSIGSITGGDSNGSS